MIFTNDEEMNKIFLVSLCTFEVEWIVNSLYLLYISKGI